MGSSGPQTRGASASFVRLQGASVSHRPEKSGLPSGARGAGAARLAFPSAVRGMFFVGYRSHWATTLDELRMTATTARKKAEKTNDLRMFHCRPAANA